MEEYNLQFSQELNGQFINLKKLKIITEFGRRVKFWAARPAKSAQIWWEKAEKVAKNVINSMLLLVKCYDRKKVKSHIDLTIIHVVGS